VILLFSAPHLHHQPNCSVTDVEDEGQKIIKKRLNKAEKNHNCFYKQLTEQAVVIISLQVDTPLLLYMKVKDDPGVYTIVLLFEENCKVCFCTFHKCDW